MMWAKNKKPGFTIVELLIVIVVIGILAAITIVAYNGIQQRAYNTKVVAGASAYVKAFQAHKAVNESYPTATGCLGANYPNNSCWASNADGTSSVLTVNTTLDTSLNEFIKTKPDVGTSLINIVIVNQFRAGAFYYATGSAYSVNAPLIGYYLKGNNADCSMKVSAQNNEGPWTQCLIALP